MSASLDTSHLTAMASEVGKRSATSLAAAVTAASLMSERTTRAPSAANWSEVSRPIPLKRQRQYSTHDAGTSSKLLG